MEHNLTKWLKDDLGLKHMSEADLYNLIYHPRHGSLCRRLVKFLVESTLCTKRYPNVYARDELEELESEHEHKKRQARGLLSRIDTQLRLTKNVESELKFTAEKLKCLSSIEDMLRTTSEALEAMARRPTSLLDQVERNLEDLGYLENSSLESLYTSLPGSLKKPTQSSDESESSLSRANLDSLVEENSSLIRKAIVISEVVGELIISIRKSQMVQRECDAVKLQETKVEHLKALQMPPIERLEVNLDEEEKQLLEERRRLVKELQESKQQVLELDQLYKAARRECDERYKQSLGEDIAMLKRWHDLSVAGE